jgi:hypothetical protein
VTRSACPRRQHHLGIAKGAPIKAVMGIMNTTPFAIIVREDANENAWDLEGKRLPAPPARLTYHHAGADWPTNSMGEVILRVDGQQSSSLSWRRVRRVLAVPRTSPSSLSSAASRRRS